MASRFRRTISFPKPSSTRPISTEKSYHVRSVSLPCRSHPLVSHLKDEINEVRTWESKVGIRSSAWFCDGLTRLKNVHDSVEDLFQLPQTRESLRRRSDWIEKLLEDFLRFVDVYGIIRGELVTLKEDNYALQVALRRRDESKIVSYVKAMKKMEKEMKKIVSDVHCIGRCSILGRSSLLELDGDIELAGILQEVNDVTILVTTSLLNGISISSSKGGISWRKLSLRNKKDKKDDGIKEFDEVEVESLLGLKKKGEEEVKRVLKKLEVLEKCIGGIESGSERMFRCLIKSRVSLLNILTH
ncbi:hypothetical protein GIB67_038249 [Kingdonia uniflora]|uniref:Uncharacterized protein n=1 Tax=Kingdonia uniflora TaxID=39325 RepID=A0A7J7MS88_9MAGN|nr:hypothetical protein GIB67_038249 [Kingdonia uniflora]